MNSRDKNNVGIVFGKWLPYHFARLAACSRQFPEAGYNIVGLQYSKGSADYSEFLDPSAEHLELPFESMEMSAEETGFSPLKVILNWSRILRKYNLKCVFLPSYWNWSLTMRIVCLFSGCKVVMMNESHAGTEKATGLKKALKKFIISRFDAALVGGAPHCRHFVSLGLPSELIHTGYDAIDNNFFSREAGKARLNSESIRLKLGLPKRYFLSLGRMVAKKNLSTLVQAFALFKKAKPDSEHRLVFVGSGQTQCELISQCLLLNLSVNVIPANDQAEADVFFCGFRQIHENPLFYALSDAFVLPSSQEEWGLVVNEAMACGLPVIVSKTVGSAEDLVIPEINGYQFDPSSAEELAVILIKLASDRQKIALMGAASSEIIRNWGCENFATRALGILEKLNITAKS